MPLQDRSCHRRTDTADTTTPPPPPPTRAPANGVVSSRAISANTLGMCEMSFGRLAKVWNRFRRFSCRAWSMPVPPSTIVMTQSQHPKRLDLSPFLSLSRRPQHTPAFENTKSIRMLIAISITTRDQRRRVRAQVPAIPVVADAGANHYYGPGARIHKCSRHPPAPPAPPALSRSYLDAGHRSYRWRLAKHAI